MVVLRFVVFLLRAISFLRATAVHGKGVRHALTRRAIAAKKGLLGFC
ncbi:hypothetical protein [Pseudomonas putida]|jgi:hypothetical protein|nr:hypothetical protein [Pseudomonas putida]